MLKHRIIPALLLQNESLVKTVKFREPKYIGDPVNTIRIFNEKEVDELMVLDISASREGRAPNYTVINEFASECFMPLTYGGGITTVEQAARLFDMGIEKICLQTAAFRDISFVTTLAERFGSQSVVVSIDIKRNWLGKPCIFGTKLRKLHRESWITIMKILVDAGAGEVLLNSVDKDGTLAGPDLEAIRLAACALPVPLIALGGISNLSDIKAAVDAGASAVAAGSFFIMNGPHRAVLITYPHYHDLENLFKLTE